MAFVAVAEVGDRVLGPLVGLGEQHPVLVLGVQPAAQLLQEFVGLRKVLAAGALALVEVRHRVEPEPVHAHPEPEVEGGEDRLLDRGVVEVEVGLVRVEAMPVVGAGLRVPGPVGPLEVLEDDPRVGVAVGGGAPDVEVPGPRARPCPPGALKPRMLVRGVVDHQLGDDLEVALVGLAQEDLEVLERAVRRVHVVVVGDVVAVVPERAGIERQQPHRGHAQVLQVVELFGQPGEVADAVRVAVPERPDVQLIDDRVAVPAGLVAHPSPPPIAHHPPDVARPLGGIEPHRSAAPPASGAARRSGGPPPHSSRPRRVRAAPAAQPARPPPARAGSATRRRAGRGPRRPSDRRAPPGWPLS